MRTGLTGLQKIGFIQLIIKLKGIQQVVGLGIPCRKGL